MGIDLKNPDAVELVLGLVEESDGLVEGFRPGVAERLGLGPDVCLARNPRFVYGRMTGWGQDGPMATMAGHDIDYISIGGALWSMGRADSAPVPPLNLVGDFGGGGMLLAFGMVAALLEAARSGEGQVVDAAMVDGAAVAHDDDPRLPPRRAVERASGAPTCSTRARPSTRSTRRRTGSGWASGRLRRSSTPRCSRVSGWRATRRCRRRCRGADWPAMKERFAAVFRSKTRDEWTAIFDGTDACVAPVLSPWEAHLHPHNVARSTFIEVAGVVQPAPSPRFSRTPSAVSKPPSPPGADTVSGLVEWGVAEDAVAKLRESGALS